MPIYIYMRVTKRHRLAAPSPRPARPRCQGSGGGERRGRRHEQEEAAAAGGLAGPIRQAL